MQNFPDNDFWKSEKQKLSTTRQTNIFFTFCVKRILGKKNERVF